MKNILLTGAGGFIGSKLAEVLSKKYGDEANVILLTSKPQKNYICIYHNDYQYQTENLLTKGVEEIDIVIHAGAYTPKSADHDNISLNFSSLVNTEYLLSHLPNVPEKIIYLSSVTVYKDFSTGKYIPDSITINEDMLPQPENHYGIVKYSSELMIQDYAKRNGIICHILRLSPVYGIGDLRRQMLMIMLEQAARGNDLKLWAVPGMVRNLLYIDDCCTFISNSLELDHSLGIVNLASTRNIIMEEIAQEIVKATNNKISYKIVEGCGVGKDMRIESKKRKKYLGEEKYSLADGINHTYGWVKKYLV